jgi:chromosome segregation ATPase
MTKWKSVQIKDEGEVVEDIIDPEAHKEIKRLKEVIVGLKEELDKSHAHEDNISTILETTLGQIGLLEAERDEKDNKISCLATKMNELLLEENKLHGEIKRLKSDLCSRWSSVESVAEEYKKLESQFRLMHNEVNKYRAMEEKARSGNYDKEFIRKLRQLLRGL